MSKMMFIKKNKVFTILILAALLLAALALFQFFVKAENVGGLNSVLGSSSDAKVMSATSSLVAHVDFNDLPAQASLIVRGTVANESETLLIQGVGGGDPLSFTNRHFDITEIYRGQPDGDSIVVREFGDLDANEALKADGFEVDPTLLAGEECILFLYKPNYGGGWNTDDDRYEIVGLYQGAFVQGEAGMFGNDMYGTTIDAGNFAHDIIAVNEAYPLDYNYQINRIKEGLQISRNNGVITQDGYSRDLREAEVYAEIVG